MEVSSRIVIAIVAAVACVSVLAGCASSGSSSGESEKEQTVSQAADTQIASTGCGRTPAAAPGRSTVGTIESGGRERSYVLHFPAGYRPDVPTPLILAFHARGGSGAGMEAYTGFDSSSAVVAYPNGIVSGGQSAWESAPYASGANDVAFVAALIDRLQSTACIDPDRIYAAGKSNGGGFTALLACELPDRIAAFGIVAGAFYDIPAGRCADPTPTPIVEFHGTADPVIHYNGGTSHGASYLSVDAWLRRQATVDGCTSSPTRDAVASTVERYTFDGCAGRGALVHYRIAGGGHTWPGATRASGPGATSHAVSATATMLAFFQAHPMRGDA